jgi:hypothetical protein
MSMKVEIRFTNTEDGRVIRYEADLDELEVIESRVTGELRITPGLLKPKGGKMPRTESPWRQYLEGDWEAKPA